MARARIVPGSRVVTPERWQRTRELFHACLDLAPPERAAHLAHECAGDASMQSEVLDLLLTADSVPDFMERPAAEAEFAGARADWIGRRVGVYRIESLLGKGGMGEVYRAVRADDQYQQAVAIKLIRSGLAGNTLLARFKAERQILATLEHPNIARILDAGLADDGSPYFVMELIDGEPLDTYCERHALPIEQRLELFCQVGSAVQYAHRHLTVHRDLKPGNILVTGDRAVKLLDFGIAKVIDPVASADRELTSLHAVTPEYASPEQIRGEPITTASDIYSLGVILYRVLTGRPPYRATNAEPYALAREVCDTQPPKPSAALSAVAPGNHSGGRRKQLLGDLDCIVMMALRKERDRRYSSVEQFIDDIRNHLAHRPVIARRSTWAYRSSRFLVRNKVVSAAAAAVFIALIGGVAATHRQARIAAAERDRAERHFNSVRELANSFMFEMNDEIAKIPGTTKVRALLVKKALTYLDLLAAEPGHDRKLQLELAEAYLRVGNVQGQVGFNNLGDHEGALASYRRGIALLEPALSGIPESQVELLQLAKAYDLISADLELLGRPEEGLQYVNKEVALVERLVKHNPDDVDARARLGVALFQRAQFRANRGETDAALADAGYSVRIYEGVVAVRPQDNDRDNLVYASANLGEIELRAKAPAIRSHGIETLIKTLSLIRALAAERPDNVKIRRHSAVIEGVLGAALAAAERPREALPHLEQALTIFRALYDKDKASRLAEMDLAEIEQNLGNALTLAGEPHRGLPHNQAAVDLMGPAPSPPESDFELAAAIVEARKDLAKTFAAVAQSAATPAAQRGGDWGNAQRSAAEALRVAHALIARKPDTRPMLAAFLAEAEDVQRRALPALASHSAIP